MKKIKILDKNTVDKIAAGEVVEGPVSVIKELVENSIDAGSTNISISINYGGIKEIRVSDNGIGIDREDVLSAFLFHATSKIQGIEDLYNTLTLGFRGEALASIASVSKLNMVTRTKDDELATKVSLREGKMVKMEEVAAPIGTTIIVENLFFNIPVRRKFLKSSNVEARNVNDIVERLAISHPNISFELIIDKKQRLKTDGDGDLKKIIYKIYGREVYDNLINIDETRENFSLKGLIGKSNIARANRRDELIFINNRLVSNKIVSKSIEEAYVGSLIKHRFPFAILYFDINSQEIDVNIHPNKLEVKLENEDEICKGVYEIIRESLSKANMIVNIDMGNELVADETNYLADDIDIINEVNSLSDEKKEYFNEKKYTSYVDRDKSQYDSAFKNNDFLSRNSKPSYYNTQIKNDSIVKNYEKQESLAFSNEKKDVQEKLFDIGSNDDIKIVGSIFDTYWVIQKNNEIFIVDQHALHEKINYEGLYKSFSLKHESQLLSPAFELSLSSNERTIIDENKDVLSKLGFVIDENYNLKEIPTSFYGIDMEELFKSLINELDKEQDIRNIDIIKDRLAGIACKMSIRGGDKISEIELRSLFKEALRTDAPFTCPHGRPTMISITKYELEKMFKRIV